MSEVLDKYIDAKKGIAAIVIRAQIDHCAGHGKQYEWAGYTIDRAGNAEMVRRECAYQLQLKEQLERGAGIVIKAKELITKG